MKIRKGTESDLLKALDIVNEKYNNNIRFKKLNYPTFTLTVNSTADSKTGFRVSRTGRKISAACWHVHGDFFDALFSINPDCYVMSQGNRIDKNSGNWIDKNIGSVYYPFYYSESCNCNN